MIENDSIFLFDNFDDNVFRDNSIEILDLPAQDWSYFTERNPTTVDVTQLRYSSSNFMLLVQTFFFNWAQP